MRLTAGFSLRGMEMHLEYASDPDAQCHAVGRLWMLTHLASHRGIETGLAMYSWVLLLLGILTTERGSQAGSFRCGRVSAPMTRATQWDLCQPTSTLTRSGNPFGLPTSHVGDAKPHPLSQG